MTPVWMKCACYVWPILPTGGVARCGQCGVRPHTVVPAPRDDKARPLMPEWQL